MEKRVALAAEASGTSLRSTVSAGSASAASSLVIQAPASQPPLALALLLPLLSSSAPCYISTHVHSSVASSAPSLVLNTPHLSRSQCGLRITLIYSDVSDTATILSPATTVLGEVTLLRHLARLAPETAGHLYEDLPLPLLNSCEEVIYLRRFVNRILKCPEKAPTRTFSTYESMLNRSEIWTLVRKDHIFWVV